MYYSKLKKASFGKVNLGHEILGNSPKLLFYYTLKVYSMHVAILEIIVICNLVYFK